ncbi:MAG: PAS domain S-box protein [Kiritimatiellia bacterium]
MAGKKILIVEDERIVALDLQERLAAIGHKIVGNIAAAGEALEKIEVLRPDLVLTDIRLDGSTDGFELADEINRRFDVPVIFITAYSDEKTLARVKATSACGFIIKPFTDEELRATIDISLHEHELEVRLRQSEEQYRLLFDEAPVGYHEIDLKGNIIRVNRTELQMLGYAAEEMIGRPVWDFAEDKEASRAAVLRKLRTSRISSDPFERNYLCRQGAKIPVLIKEYAILSAKGVLRGIRSTVQDISLLKEEQARRQRLEASLRQAEKLESIGVMAGGLAHELNNQLMAIQGNASLAMLNLADGSREARGYLETVLSSCQRSAAVIAQLLVCAGKVKGEFKPLDLTKIVFDLLPSISKIAGEGVEIIPRLASGLPPIMGDAGQLRHLVTLLAENAGDAIRHGPGKGTIQVVTGLGAPEEEGSGEFEIILRRKVFAGVRQCCLSIVDDGKGMDKKTLERLFDPFFTTKGVGRGLGLSAALGIVKNHDGAILVKSMPGSGTTVKIAFDPV